ncbi:BQ2448_7536 [Microbotryum intermedium]|uniref:BQ2448_7536 protein n=1 Tax=Microbotryum intermedium TaxID=269621 RepID=A0A238FML7_9BASI|nr:BQ2448_7536 [Microbotryum intermedium]
MDTPPTTYPTPLDSKSQGELSLPWPATTSSIALDSTTRFISPAVTARRTRSFRHRFRLLSDGNDAATSAPNTQRTTWTRRIGLLLLVVVLATHPIGPDLKTWFLPASTTGSDGDAIAGSKWILRYPAGVKGDGGMGTLKMKEEVFLSVPKAESARNTSHSHTFETHIAGTPADRRSALRVKAQFEHGLGLPLSDPEANVFQSGSEQSRRALYGTKKTTEGTVSKRKSGWETLLSRYGIEITTSKEDLAVRPRVWVDTYYPLLNYPVRQALSLTRPNQVEPYFVASLKEDVLPEDPTSGQGPPPFHGFSKNGTAKGQLVYVGRGTHAEFKAIHAKGIDFKGKIVIAQYSGSFRGLKVQVAAEYGAVGVLIYSDPVSDFNQTVEKGERAYPYGPARQPSSVQRGSVQFLSIYPGDPLTPGLPAYENATRLDEHDYETLNIPSIPSLPISYEDAIPLLKSLNGKGWKNEDRAGAQGWKEGGLRYRGVEYWSGPGEDEVELVNIMQGGVNKIWNTYAFIPGAQVEDEVVIVGNHRDAWTFGAGDPISGTASVIEVVKGFGELLRRGWKPHRSILFASWDAEEYGLIGSTEFGEDYATFIQERVVAYLNVDISTTGSGYGIRASPSLGVLVQEMSRRVLDPVGVRKGESLMHGLEERKRVEATKGQGIEVVEPLGSGSDYTVFLQHLGIASWDTGYSPLASDAVYHYHSSYDSAYWMDHFGDRSFERHIAIAQVLGLVALRLGEQTVLKGLDVAGYASELERYLKEVPQVPEGVQGDREGLKKGMKEVGVAIEAIQQAAKGLEKETEQVEKDLLAMEGQVLVERRIMNDLERRVRSINQRRRTFEQGFLDPKGLKGREWYKNLVVAPGRHLGYGATTLPGLTEAITLDGDLQEAVVEVWRLREVFERVARRLKGE